MFAASFLQIPTHDAPLTLGYTLPAIGRIIDLHRLDYVHAGEQKNRLLSSRIISGLISLQVVLPE